MAAYRIGNIGNIGKKKKSKKYKKILGLLIIFLVIFCFAAILINKKQPELLSKERSELSVKEQSELQNNEQSEKSINSIYGETEASDYLSGKFSPASHELFVALDKESIPTDERKHYLRKETVYALKKMLDDFSKEHPQIKIYVRSATRTYNDQSSIWNRKWQANISIKDEHERALKILQYSSMPGISRHHWGSDFDINELIDEYYLKGDGKTIYSWLTANAAKYGFYQPYTAGREKGYCEEKWHWSYKPLSSKFIKDWNNNFSGDSVNKLKGFSGSEKSLQMAKEYVNSINPDCF